MNDADEYYTPGWCLDAIFGEMRWEKCTSGFLEPCAGDGRIVTRVLDLSVILADCVHAYEINNPSTYCIDGSDYLAHDLKPHGIDLCITNPPFSLWIEFTQKALRECKGVIMLGRLSMLGTKKRKGFWRGNRPSHMWVLSERPSFEGPAADAAQRRAKMEGKTKSKTDNSEYAWFGWRMEPFAWKPPGIYHL